MLVCVICGSKDIFRMAKPTKKKQLAVRDSTYREQEVPCCGNCLFAWLPHWSNTTAACHAVKVRDRIQVKRVSVYGVCDLWEKRYSREDMK